MLNRKDLLGTEDLSKEEILSIIDLAEQYSNENIKNINNTRILKNITQINLFFENSTRTQVSFEIAGTKLGTNIVNFPLKTSSQSKGETLLDLAATLNSMFPDILVIRHPKSGAVQLISEKVKCAVINAGDGNHEHPTQALLDAQTIRKRLGRISGLKIAICGDIAHSRVARSNIFCLKTLGNKIRVVGPKTLIPKGIESLGVEVTHNMFDGLQDIDVVMVLRLQKERMDGGFLSSEREYFHYYGLDERKMQYANPNAIIMHPGPMNRGIEIDGDLADDINRSVITKQVEVGLAIRMAVLDLLTRGHPLRKKCPEH
ncbi:MAG: aspartate carbamoyltransferase catalytic subunit [Rhodobacteraceae bacterium]|nr:MAG: aspartate carbamoyltransferase catalytic subunit [Paracoccaceae bacterium]